MSVKTAVLVSGGGTNLQALIDASVRGELPHVDLCLVVSSNPDAYALRRAENAGIEAVAIPRKGMAQDAFEDQLLNALKERGVKMVILAGFMSILSERVIRAYPNAILNVHPSLIPAFCGKGFYGLRVHEAALKRGVKVTGCTVHLVNEIPDGGPILAQKAVEILENDTPETLQRRVMETCEWKLLPACAEQVAARLENA
ncbi:MAG: phosphoribosylglycinamide formyltransferase [Clostridia bacterium]|nr:phosphoribosylglycinamide formyltransferase [Clostridia bacterium]